MSNLQKLTQVAQDLSEEMLAEVIDFAEYLKQKKSPPSSPLDPETTGWLEAGLADAAQAIQAAEEGIPEEELNAWLQIMEQSVKPL